MVRAAQKGEMEDPSPEITKVASTVSKSDVKKMASTKHKGLPEKVPANEGYVSKGAVNIFKKGIKRHKKAVDAKKVKERKAPPYAALTAEYYPELPTTEGYQRDPEQSKKDRTHSKQPDPSKDGFTGIGNMSIKDIMKMNAKIKASEAAKTKKEEVVTERLGGAGTLVRQGVKVGGKAGGRAVQQGQFAAIKAGQGAKAKASQGNQSKMVGSGKFEKAAALAGGVVGGVAGGVLDGPLPVGDIVGGIAGSKVGGKIGRQLDKKFSKEEVELEEERSARKLNVRSKKTIQTTIKKDAEKEAKRRANKTGEYKETPKKKPKLGLGYTTVVKHAQAKKAAAKKVPAAKKTPVTKATVKAASKKVAPSTKSDARTKAQYKGKGAPGLDAHKERIAKHEAKRGVKKPKAAKKTPVTKATTTKPAPKKAPARKSVKSTPITKAASTPKKQKTFGDFVKQGVKRHRKATQGARVFGKGFAKGVKKSVKFAKDVKKVITNEQVNKVSAMVKSIKRKKEVLRQPEKAMDAGARAKRKLLRREYEAKVSTFVPDELKDHKTWDNFRQRL